MLISKEKIQQLAAPYLEPEMIFCYAQSQSSASMSSKAILLLDDTQVTILFLNLALTKVVQQTSYPLSELEKSTVRKSLFEVIWRFSVGKRKYKFRLMKAIRLSTDMQGPFIQKLSSMNSSHK